MDFSIQLYSARNEASLEETLKTLKQLGYTQVEGWGGQFSDPQALATTLQKVDIAMPTAHIGYTQLEDTAAAIKIAQAIGIKTIYCPAPPTPDYREGKGDWNQLAQGLARIGTDLKSAGIGFGYHNHSWELARTSDSSYPIETILNSSPDMQWEMDLAWLIKAGEDPLVWFDKFGDHITAIHVKDIAPSGEALDEDGWADVGHGTLDWQQLLAAAKQKTRAQYFVAEHDKPNDAIRFARRSIDSVKKWM